MRIYWKTCKGVISWLYAYEGVISLGSADIKPAGVMEFFDNYQVVSEM